MDFVRSHFGKMNLWPVEHFFEHIHYHFWLAATANPPKSDDKYIEKLFNWSEVHLSEMTWDKIHTLMCSSYLKALNSCSNFYEFKIRKSCMNYDLLIKWFNVFCKLRVHIFDCKHCILRTDEFCWSYDPNKPHKNIVRSYLAYF